MASSTTGSNGWSEPGLGVLYRCSLDRADNADLVANYDGHSADIEIHGEGCVDSSNNIGCSTSGGAGLGWPPLALPALVIRRRR